MCEVLPTIVDEEDLSSPSPDGENTKLEQLMISMLEERDKLMENLRESQEDYKEATKRLGDVETDNKILMRQLQALMPEEEDRLDKLLDDLRSGRGGTSNGVSEDVRRWPVAQRFANLARELAAANDRLSEKEEQIDELKSERSNTRLLLEHLECLVARHERSLRMTVVKRQTSNAGVSSETEVLKALKSLFDHHKALDEKVRERLRTAQERIAILEDELMLGNQEMKTLQDENKRMKRFIQQKQRNSVRLSMVYDNVSLTKEQLALMEERDQAIDDLQFSLDEKDAQLDEMMHLRDDLAEKVQELDEELTMALSELKRLKMANKKHITESTPNARMESKVTQLESQLADSRQELSSLREKNQQLQDQFSAQEVQFIKLQEEQATVGADLKQKELILSDLQANNELMLQTQTERLSEAQFKQGTAQSTIGALKEDIDKKQKELKATQEKERINEANISQLQSAVDRMLKESRERLKTYSNERKQLVEEKVRHRQRAEQLDQELSSTRVTNKELNEKIEELQAKLNKNNELVSESSNKVELRSKKTRSPNPLRNSLRITDLDTAMENRKRESPTPTEGSSQLQTEPTVNDEASEDWDVTNLVSMLENQVSRLDQQLESMGGDMSEASEFDRVMQSMSEGTYSSSSAMETFPHSSLPVLRHSKKSKYRPDVLPSSTLYRVNTPTAPSPEHISPSSTASSNDSTTPNGQSNSKKSSLRSKSSFRKLFRPSRKGSRKKNQARRASAPVSHSASRFGDSVLIRESVDFSDLLESSDEREEDRKRKSELLNSVLEQSTPFSRWDSHTLLAWLEVWVGVPFWYIAAIRNCLQNGEMLASIADSELEQELGITNSLHRLKLRLAVHEIVSITSTEKLHRTTSLFGEMAHEWVGDYWLPSLGLAQYKELFKMCLVDARMLEHLTKKDLRTALKMVDATHRNSLQYGISVLKKLDYNRQELEQRREKVNVTTMKDVLVWSTDHVMKWVESLGLREYSANLCDSGVHGGVITLDNGFDYQKLALALKIPQTNPEVRQQLKLDFGKLLAEGTNRVSSESQSHGKIVRRLSKKLKVGSRKVVPPNEFAAVRPHSPVLYHAKPTPLYLHSLLEQSDSGSSQNTTTNSVDNSDISSPRVELKMT